MSLSRFKGMLPKTVAWVLKHPRAICKRGGGSETALVISGKGLPVNQERKEPKDHHPEDKVTSKASEVLISQEMGLRLVNKGETDTNVDWGRQVGRARGSEAPCPSWFRSSFLP